MKYRIDFTEEEHEWLIRILQEKIEDGGAVESMKNFVKLFEKIDDAWQELKDD